MGLIIAIQILFNAVLAVLAFHVGFYRVDKKSKTLKFYYGLILLCIVGSSAITYYQFHDTEQSQSNSQTQLNEFETNLLQNAERGKREIELQYNNLIANQTRLIAQNDNLQQQLATNQWLNPDLRERIIESNKRFNEVDMATSNWLNAIQANLRADDQVAQIKHEQQLSERQKQGQANWDNCVPYYDFAVRTIYVLMNKMAITLGDKVIPEYGGMPASIQYGMGRTNIAEVHLQTNTNIAFSFIGILHSYDQSSYLTITCSGGYLDVVVSSPSSVNTYRHYTDNNYSSNAGSDNNATNVIFKEVLNLFAMEMKQQTNAVSSIK
jgi:hypothetical protein